ncbi:MAG TPA: MBL fold metallo-hydrolase [Candidatus Acidoferrales bacterium]|nr:MBL fold metallo-hydrolase [Candidatus Acidoferrales bacterium]
MTELALSEVADSVWRLSLPMPWSPLGSVHCYLFPRGDRVDMIDCGLKTEDSAQMVQSAVERLGGVGARVGNLVVTHIHPDHYGGAGEIVSRDSSELYIHRLEVPMIRPRYREVGPLLHEIVEYFVVHGVPNSEAELMKDTSMGLLQFVVPVLPTVQLDGSELLRLGRRELRVVWTPGHSPGHVCLFDASDGLLFAGDHLLPNESPNIGLHPQSTPNPLDDFLAGLVALLALSPQVVLPSHGGVFNDPGRRVDELFAHHQRRKSQIEQIVAGGAQSGWEVARSVWGPRDPHSMRLALQEGLAHLQSLAYEARVEKRVEARRVMWRPPR